LQETIVADWVQIQTDGGAFKAYVEKPAGAPKAAVVVIQEIFGVNKVLRGKCAWLAKEGFLAIAPDLFWRIEPGVDITDQSEAEWAKAFSLYKAFDGQAGTVDIQKTIDVARGMVGGGKVGAVGYCLGGYLAYMTACTTTADASVGYYGVGIENQLALAGGMRAPLALHVARKDQFVPPPAQDAIKQGLERNPKVTLFFYADQDHAFTREGGAHYDAHAAELADGRTVAFFKQHLG
jgi:carboxymethylenebutenolidase